MGINKFVKWAIGASTGPVGTIATGLHALVADDESDLDFEKGLPASRPDDWDGPTQTFWTKERKHRLESLRNSSMWRNASGHDKAILEDMIDDRIWEGETGAHLKFNTYLHKIGALDDSELATDMFDAMQKALMK